MNKDKKFFGVVVILIAVASGFFFTGLYLYLQRDNAFCEATASFQNAERSLWLGIIDGFITNENTATALIAFIDEQLPEVKCIQGNLTPVGE